MKNTAYIKHAPDKSIDEKWRKNDIIRNKKTGIPYLVKHMYAFISTEVVDLFDKRSPTPSLTILPKDYSDYVVDEEYTPKKEKKIDGCFSLDMFAI